MKSFPYPLPEHALAEFCHPAYPSAFSRPVRHDGEVLAGNGYLALRCQRGAWIYDEFPDATPEFLERFDSLPWLRALGPQWRLLDQAARDIYRAGVIAPWAGFQLAATPIVRVGVAVVRLSLLQLVGRMPRCEVYTGPLDRTEPLYFRFSGGRGIVAADPKLTLWSREIFPPRHDCMTGQRVDPNPLPKPSFSLPGWPPADPSDA